MNSLLLRYGFPIGRHKVVSEFLQEKSQAVVAEGTKIHSKQGKSQPCSATVTGIVIWVVVPLSLPPPPKQRIIVIWVVVLSSLPHHLTRRLIVIWAVTPSSLPHPPGGVLLFGWSRFPLFPGMEENCCLGGHTIPPPSPGATPDCCLVV